MALAEHYAFQFFQRLGSPAAEAATVFGLNLLAVLARAISHREAMSMTK